MSAYTQPAPYSNGTVLDTNDITSNEESLKVFVNQELDANDIATGKLITKDIARGIGYQNIAVFQSGMIAGINQLRNPLNRSYSTSTTKNNAPTASIQWQDIANSGAKAIITQPSKIVIHLYLKYYVPDNLNLPNNGGQRHGAWQNEIRLRRRSVIGGTDSTYIATDNYCFEGTGASLDTKDPGNDQENASHRSIMLTYYNQISTAGEYWFVATVDPHNEMGYSTVKSITVEVFPI
jgi:hypothetical protein